MPTGRLMKNAHRQSRFSTTKRTERRSGRAGDGADRAPDRDGRGIFSRGKVCSTSASEAGTSAAAPTACSMRARISTPTVGARPHSIDATVNTITAARNVRRRPTAVGEPAERDQQRGEGDRVGVEHPRHRRGADAERSRR